MGRNLSDINELEDRFRDHGDETRHDPEHQHVLRQAANLGPVSRRTLNPAPERHEALAEARQAGTMDKLLDTRGKTHGNYSVQTRVTEGINHLVLSNMTLPENLTDGARHAIYMIATKLGRIAAGDPDFGDHWRDIAGYSKLQADRCTKG